MSDKYLTDHSGILKKLLPGDVKLADGDLILLNQLV